MPKQSKILTVKEINALSFGEFPIGGVKGLYVRKREGSLQYFLRWNDKGKNKKLFVPIEYSLKEARLLAQEWRKLIEKGIDPKEVIRSEKERAAQEKQVKEVLEKEKEYTFTNAYRLYCLYQRETNRWKNSRDGEKKQEGLAKKYLLPILGEKSLKEIQPKDIAAILNPVYLGRSATADKLKTIVNGVYKWANSVNFAGLEDYYPVNTALNELTRQAKKNGKEEKPHPALPYHQIPSFIKEVQKYESPTSRAVIFAILTATRSQAAREVKWTDLDLDNGIYQMRIEVDKIKDPKANRTIYLSTQLVEWLKSMPRLGEYVFPSGFRLNALTSDALSSFIRKLRDKKKAEDGIGWVDPNLKDENGEPRGITLHGTARASFSTWARDDENGNNKRFTRAAAEFNLLHDDRSKVEKAYNRNLLAKERREIMQAWSDFCLQKINLF